MFNQAALCKAMNRANDLFYGYDGEFLYIASPYWIARLKGDYPKVIKALQSRFGTVEYDGFYRQTMDKLPGRCDVLETFQRFLRQDFWIPVYDSRLTYHYYPSRDLQILSIDNGGEKCYTMVNTAFWDCIKRDYISLRTTEVARTKPILAIDEFGDECMYILPVNVDLPQPLN